MSPASTMMNREFTKSTLLGRPGPEPTQGKTVLILKTFQHQRAGQRYWTDSDRTYFLPDRLNGENYLEFLQIALLDLLLPILPDAPIIFQYDGCPARYVQPVYGLDW
ncbi:unnamed protein product [Acanthoscelides obtectus]|uniref:Uncharacterized protein n=1 Tax=Acanthoscelides obtectus TaxID=200917 RepID=A0A9P0PUV0_ACAOB|nr:unnamed protein product [Acanthoscelides obtectus]CAK1641995.1 hypothetical protein AOBTE_LOCUS12780 [Acanthoscelides obtectus]